MKALVKLKEFKNSVFEFKSRGEFDCLLKYKGKEVDYVEYNEHKGSSYFVFYCYPSIYLDFPAAKFPVNWEFFFIVKRFCLLHDILFGVSIERTDHFISFEYLLFLNADNPVYKRFDMDKMNALLVSKLEKAGGLRSNEFNMIPKKDRKELLPKQLKSYIESFKWLVPLHNNNLAKSFDKHHELLIETMRTVIAEMEAAKAYSPLRLIVSGKH